MKNSLPIHHTYPFLVTSSNHCDLHLLPHLLLPIPQYLLLPPYYPIKRSVESGLDVGDGNGNGGDVGIVPTFIESSTLDT